jgi:hypothetical protein
MLPARCNLIDSAALSEVADSLRVLTVLSKQPWYGACIRGGTAHNSCGVYGDHVDRSRHRSIFHVPGAGRCRPAGIPAKCRRRRPLERGSGVQGNPDLCGQQPHRPVDALSDHPPKHRAPLPAAGDPAGLHAPLFDCQISNQPGLSLRPTDLPEHDRWRLHKRSARLKRHDSSR